MGEVPSSRSPTLVIICELKKRKEVGREVDEEKVFGKLSNS